MLYFSGSMCVGVNGVVRLGWCGILMQAEAKQSKGSDIKLVSLYSSIKMMHGPINVRLIIPDC